MGKEKGNIFGTLKTKRQVVVHVTFLKIGEINTLKEQFEADVLIRSRWREPLLDRHDKSKNTSIDWGKYWDPKLYIDNFVTEPKKTSSRFIEREKGGEAYVLERQRLKGTFMEQLELWEFPFDVQVCNKGGWCGGVVQTPTYRDLSIVILSDVPASEIEIIEDPDEIHKIYKQSFIDEQEWYLYKYVESNKQQRLKDLADPTLLCVALTVRCRAARRPAYFIWNILSVTIYCYVVGEQGPEVNWLFAPLQALITFLAFTTFAVPHELPQNRLQLTFTLILTSVAFKFVVHQSLPRISYLTYLDRYILAAMAMLTVTCVWHGLQTKIDAADRHDYVALVVLISIYILYNLQFFIRIILVPYGKRREMRRLEREYTQIVKNQALMRAGPRSFQDEPEDKLVKCQAIKKKKPGDCESRVPLASLDDM